MAIVPHPEQWRFPFLSFSWLLCSNSRLIFSLFSLKKNSDPAKKVEPFSVPSKKVELPAKKAEPAAAEEDEDDDIDLFGSDDEEEDQEAAKVREERLRQYAEKKAKKPGLIAKSSILLDVKPVSDWNLGALGARLGILSHPSGGGIPNKGIEARWDLLP